MSTQPLSIGTALAAAVAAAADAWLTDPRDTQAYSRLIRSVGAWRAYTFPVLPGTEHAGTRPFPDEHEPFLTAPPPENVRPAEAEPEFDLESPSKSAPRPIPVDLRPPPGQPITDLADLLAGDPAAVLARLRRGK